jgi:PPOX class probable F420-dependent enzyme
MTDSDAQPGASPDATSAPEADARQDALLKLVAEQDGGVLVTLKRDGRPQLSNVNHAYYPDERVVRVSITDDRAKTRNLRRDPRASYHVTSKDRWAWTVVEGTADLTPVAADPHDDTVEELITLYRDVQGEHPDWDDYRRAMVEDRRLVLRLRVERAYGQPRA